MQQQHNESEDPQIDQGLISFDYNLLASKKNIIHAVLAGQEQNSQQLLRYPNEQLQALSALHVKQHGKLFLFKSTTTIYFGQTSNDLYHGYGLLIYKSNPLRFYQGSFQNNCKYGYGMEFIHGDLYMGKFVNNKPEDQNGIFIWGNGDVYHGAFVSGMKHGLGKWQSGDQFYSGTWKFNKPEGQGYIKSALSQYNGNIKNGYKHGEGIELFNNGDRYEGMYSNGKPEGSGTYAWNNGSIYKGEFKNGLRFGFGVWQYGAEKYEGTYINDKRNGEGIYTWQGGSYYKGTFVEDLRHGFGQMHWDEDSFYRGEWAEGMQNGEGEIFEKGKLVQKGVFIDGKLKAETDNYQNQTRRAPLPNLTNKLVAQKKTQNVPVFEQRKRFNSFQSRNTQYKPLNQKQDRYFHQSFYDKQNQAILQRKREINKRYSFFEKRQERKGLSHRSKQPLLKLNDKTLEQVKESSSRQKQKHHQIKASIAKIQLYKKLRKERRTESIVKKANPTKLANSFEREVMFETQLAPIKWKNFGHVGSF